MLAAREDGGARNLQAFASEIDVSRCFLHWHIGDIRRAGNRNTFDAITPSQHGFVSLFVFYFELLGANSHFHHRLGNGGGCCNRMCSLVLYVAAQVDSVGSVDDGGCSIHLHDLCRQ